LVFISHCYHESHRGELFLKHWTGNTIVKAAPSIHPSPRDFFHPGTLYYYLHKAHPHSCYMIYIMHSAMRCIQVSRLGRHDPEIDRVGPNDRSAALFTDSIDQLDLDR